MGKVESAKEAAAGLPHGRGFCSSARCIMNWTKVFLETEMLPVSKQGQHQKRTSLLSDEDVSIRIHEWLLQTSKVHRTPDKLCRWINESLLVEIMGSTCHNISERTVNRWMNTMGYKYGMWKKGIFIDAAVEGRGVLQLPLDKKVVSIGGEKKVVLAAPTMPSHRAKVFDNPPPLQQEGVTDSDNDNVTFQTPTLLNEFRPIYSELKSESVPVEFPSDLIQEASDNRKAYALVNPSKNLVKHYSADEVHSLGIGLESDRDWHRKKLTGTNGEHHFPVAEANGQYIMKPSQLQNIIDNE